MTHTIVNLIDLVAPMMEIEAACLNKDNNLIEQGLDSISIMRVAAYLKAKGYKISMASLIQKPTINAWETLLAAMDLDGVASVDSKLVVDNKFALTPIQQAYFIGRSPDQKLGGIDCQLYAEFDGQDISVNRMKDAIARLFKKHAMLRAVFHPNGIQEILEDSLYSDRLIVNDWINSDANTVEVSLQAERERLAHYQYNIFSGETTRFTLSLLPERKTRLHININLLIADVVSLSIIYKDLASAYNCSEEIKTTIFNFPDYLSRVGVPYTEVDKVYWTAKLKEMGNAPTLPIISMHEYEVPRFERHLFHVEKDKINLLRDKAAREGLTLASIFVAAFSLVVARWSSNRHFLLNMPIFDRKPLDPAVDDMVADFTNLLILDIEARSEFINFDTYAKNIQAKMHADLSHSEYCGLNVLRDLKQIKPETEAPIVFACNFNQLLTNEEFENTFGKLNWSLSQTPQVLLDHQIYQLSDSYLLNFDVVAGAFPKDMIKDMFVSYQEYIQQLITKEWTKLGTVTIPLQQSIARQKLIDGNVEIPKARLHDPFLATVAAYPDHHAIAWSQGTMTYQDLYKRSNALAHLLQQKGMKPGDHIAIILPKGPEQVVSVLAVLMAGGVYIPIASDHSINRIRAIISNAECSFVIASNHLQYHLSQSERIKLLTYDDINDYDYDVPQVICNRSATEAAYIIYTSGSTGDPKGVVITHQAALNTILDVNKRWEVNSHDVIISLSALSFDLSVYDIFGLLAVGGTIVLPDELGRHDPSHWHELINRFGVNLWNSVPALMQIYVEHVEALPHNESPLRLVLLSGDWIPTVLPSHIKAISSKATIVGLGGATEASIWSNWYEIEDVDPSWVSIPYGYPLSNQFYQVLDCNLDDCPDWVEGDLFIGGAGVAEAYWNDPVKTRNSFVMNKAGQRIYRTGDRARFWPDGVLEFLGRIDTQVKIRGHRIELGEIESVLNRFEGVISTICDVKKLNDRQILIGYIMIGYSLSYELPSWLADNTFLDSDKGKYTFVEGALHRHFSKYLPGYMVPRYLYLIDEIPLSSNGKVDRSVLPIPYIPKREKEENNKDNNSLPERMRSVWGGVLNSTITDETNFFERGGDSLLAIRLTSQLSDELKSDISVRLLYEHPVFNDFIKMIKNLISH